MPGEQNWFDDFSFPALLRVGRRTYSSAIAQALAEEGCADMPRNGSFVIGAIARTGAPLSEIITALGASKQAAGQLVDTLVALGYLARAADPGDRRRLTISLTGRGHAAAEVIRDAVERVDASVLRRVGPEHVAHTRATLAALIEARHDVEAHGHDQ